MARKNLIKTHLHIAGFAVLIFLIILSLILSLGNNITGKVIGVSSVDIQEDLTADVLSMQIGRSSPYRLYEIYSLDLTLKRTA